MKRVAFAILLFALPTVAKDKDKAPIYAVNCDDPKSYACNQYLRLELQQQKTLAAYAAFQAALTELNAEARQVAQENGWPDDVRFNSGNLTFSAPPAPAAAVPPGPGTK